MNRPAKSFKPMQTGQFVNCPYTVKAIYCIFSGRCNWLALFFCHHAMPFSWRGPKLRDYVNHHRCSIRLRDFDYSSGGAYSVTVCTFGRECLFGEVGEGVVRLNEAGFCVESVWESLPQRYPEIALDAFVVMPNHIHGIIMINNPVGAIHESPLHESPRQNHPTISNRAIHELPLQRRRSMILSKVVGYLKMNSAKRINQLRNTPGIPVWQRNYYERVIRDDRELDAIREYIAGNPVRWGDDENHPERQFG